MTLTTAQIREACNLLGWKSAMLCRRAKVSFRAAWSARQDGQIGAVSISDLQAIRATLENAGVRFTSDPDGESNAKLVTAS